MYEKKKWAFVSDYVRLYALLNYGGFYLDTDVRVLKRFDSLLKYSGVCGFEENNQLSTAFLACEPHFRIFNRWFDTYKNKEVSNEQPNTIMFTNICRLYGLKLNNKRQKIEKLEVFPTEYFSPKDYRTNQVNITENTFTVHLFGESWRTAAEKKIHSREAKLVSKYGWNKGQKIAMVVNSPLKVYNAIKKKGVLGEIKFILAKYK